MLKQSLLSTKPIYIRKILNSICSIRNRKVNDIFIGQVYFERLRVDKKITKKSFTIHVVFGNEIKSYRTTYPYESLKA